MRGVLLRHVDERVWRSATWASPFTIQVVLGCVVGISWLAGKYSGSPHGFGQFAIGAVATVLLSAAISAALFAKGSLRTQGVAISIIGSVVVALVGATAYGFWVIGW